MTDAREPGVPEPLRRRLDAVFGDVLPDVTRDEAAEPELTDPGAADPGTPGPGTAGPGAAADRPDAPGSARQDAWLRANRPPHHDRD